VRKLIRRLSAFNTLPTVILSGLLTACPSAKISYRDPAQLSSGALFSCAPGASQSVPAPLQRLSQLQYQNTFRDLMATRFTNPSEVAQAVAAVQAQMSLFPPDYDSNFARVDTRLGQDHINSIVAVALALGNWLGQDSGRMSRFTKGCSSNADPSSCIDGFLRDFALHVFRRPLTKAELSNFKTAWQQAGGDGFRYVISRILASPYFIYQVQDQSTPDAADRRSLRLSAYELASRLSYQLWDSMPDEELFQAAASGQILNDAFYRKLVESYFAGGPKTDRIRPTFARFFREWFDLDQVPQMDPGMTAAFAKFTDGVDIHAQGVDLRSEMINEVLDLSDYYTWQEPGTLEDIFTTKANFAKGDTLAALYGTSKWIPGEKPNELGDPERAGVLTRAAMMASGNESTRPLHRGAFIRQRILCDELATPEDVGIDPSLVTPPVMDPTKSSRQRFAEKTAPALCQSCHAHINPLGFAMESIDSLGRVRSQERVYDENGELRGTPSIDTVVEPLIEAGDHSELDGPAALSLAIAGSTKAESCFARYYFRYVYRRIESPATDGCALVKMRNAIQGNNQKPGTLREVFMQAVLDPAFKLRAVPN
jgi:hypothetical protein